MSPDAERQAWDLDRRHAWHPFTPFDEWLAPGSEPVFVESGRGSVLADREGNEYLDGNSSIWTNLHGHGHPRITGAIKAQLDRIAHSSYLGLAHEPGARLAGELCRRMGFDPGRAFFSDDGSTAVEAALKLAIQYFHQNGAPERTLFLRLGGGYHGDTLGAVSVGRSEGFHRAYAPLLFPTEEVGSPACYRCPYNQAKPEAADARTYAKCRRECVGEVAAVLKRRGAETAAFVIEPRVQGAAGMTMHPEGYLAEVAPLVREAGAFLIADEVLTGFGRTGAMLASEKEGVAPDFVALAKGLTGGYLPMGATLVRETVADGFRGGLDRTFFHGHSYTGNQLGCAAALANLETFDVERTLEVIALRAETLRKASQVFWTLPYAGDVRQEGMILAVELVRDRATREPFPAEARLAHRIGEEARRHGLLTRGLGGTLFLLPPYCTSAAQVERMVDILFRAAQKVLSE